MTDNGCKREMTFEEERLAFNAKIKELLFAEDEYPNDSLLKCFLRDSQRILGKASWEIGTLHNRCTNLLSEVSAINMGYEHTKELLEIEKATVKRANERFFKAKKDLEETQEKLEALLCEATGGLLSKHSYTAATMTTYAHDYVLKCCDEAQAEAVKELATDVINNILPKYMQGHSEQALKISLAISERVKEMAGES